MNLNDIKQALGRPTHHTHSEALLRRLESTPCSVCDRPKEIELRSSKQCLACLRKEMQEDGLDVEEFDRMVAGWFGGAR